MKVTVLALRTKSLAHNAENEQRRKEQIMEERTSKGTITIKVCTYDCHITHHAERSRPSLGVFHGPSISLSLIHHPQLELLAQVSNPGSTLELQQLSSDPSIKHMIVSLRLSVGLLTRLAPHGHPDFLGLIVNAGEAIQLHPRMNRYDGFRSYNDMSRALL